jgi:uncharacterized membrane protein
MKDLFLFSLLNFIHLVATVAWFGAMTTNALILLPSLRKSLDADASGKLMGMIMKRFRVLVYICIGALVISGIGITEIKTDGPNFMQFSDLWYTISSIKHIFTAIAIILAIYAFEGLGKKISRLALNGYSAESARLQNRQKTLSYTGLGVAIIILILTAILTAN